MVRNLPCMQIFVIWAEVNNELSTMSFLQSPGIQGQNMRLVNATISLSGNLFLVINNSHLILDLDYHCH